MRADVGTMVNVAKEGPAFGFTKTDMSAKVSDYVDLSYLSAATGKPVRIWVALQDESFASPVPGGGC